MKEILFRVPLFHEGLNVTVRRGRKWFDSVRSGDKLRVLAADTGMFHREVSVVLAVLFPHLDEVPEFLLRFEHDEPCRTREGLVAELDRVYGVGQWEGHGLTVLLLWANDTPRRHHVVEA